MRTLSVFVYASVVRIAVLDECSQSLLLGELCHVGWGGSGRVANGFLPLCFWFWDRSSCTSLDAACRMPCSPFSPDRRRVDVQRVQERRQAPVCTRPRFVDSSLLPDCISSATSSDRHRGSDLLSLCSSILLHHTGVQCCLSFSPPSPPPDLQMSTSTAPASPLTLPGQCTDICHQPHWP